MTKNKENPRKVGQVKRISPFSPDLNIN